jgi:hypothetical protein
MRVGLQIPVSAHTDALIWFWGPKIRIISSDQTQVSRPFYLRTEQASILRIVVSDKTNIMDKVPLTKRQ